MIRLVLSAVRKHLWDFKPGGVLPKEVHKVEIRYVVVTPAQVVQTYKSMTQPNERGFQNNFEVRMISDYCKMAKATGIGRGKKANG